MKDLIIPVNNEALSRALIAVAGEEATKTIVAAYKLIDAAMVFGYEKSQSEEADLRKKLAEDYIAATQSNDDSRQDYADDAFHRGFQEAVDSIGFAPAEQESYEDGYVDGVSDARVFPEFADAQLELLCASDAYDEYGEDLYQPEDDFDWEDGLFDDYYDDEDDFEWYYEGDSGDEDDSDEVKINARVEGQEYTEALAENSRASKVRA